MEADVGAMPRQEVRVAREWCGRCNEAGNDCKQRLTNSADEYSINDASPGPSGAYRATVGIRCPLWRSFYFPISLSVHVLLRQGY